MPADKGLYTARFLAFSTVSLALMIEVMAVNQALQLLDTYSGKDVTIRGVLRFEFECTALYESIEDYRYRSDSAIWVSVGSGSLGFDRRVCEKLDGKEVTVQGTLFKPDPVFGGCGHLGGFPAEILARTLERA